MKFSYSVVIAAPIETVAAAFRDRSLFAKWQEGFKSVEQQTGNQDEVGSVALLNFEFRGRPMVLKETVKVNDFPAVFEAVYDPEHMSNIQHTEFSSERDGKTRLTTTVDYFVFYKFLPKLMMTLLSGMFKKQAGKWYDNFKVLLENK